MKFSISMAPMDKNKKSCLLIGLYEDGSLTPTAHKINKASKGYLANLLKKGTITGKLGQTLHLFNIPALGLEHILLVGCGKADSITPSAYRKIISQAINACVSANVTKAVCYLAEVTSKQSLPQKIRQLVENTHMALYRFDHYKSKKEPSPNLNELVIDLPEIKAKKACDIALSEAIAISNGMNFTKNLANQPSNICTPTYLAQKAKELAKTYRSLSVKVLEEIEMKKLGMGALLAVSQGSAEAAKLICLEYKGAGSKSAPVALVGKGITFDTGGNSLKPADSMVGMKYDMCGAATVLGTMQAIAELKLPINVVGLVPAVENMPGGTAYKPEDILTSMSGQTIEVISTDAEGRLILADALTYAERYKPEVVIDIATLTGAVVIALGFHATGLLSNDDELADELLRAGIESHDRAWHLPLWEEYQEQIKSPFADMANSGGRSAGTITAACFLSRFTKKFKWAHLDVAGTAAMMMGTSDRHATGRPVPMLVQYLINRT